VAITADRRGDVTGLPHLAVLAFVEHRLLALVTTAAGIGDVCACDSAVGFRLGLDIVRAVARRAGGRGTAVNSLAFHQLVVDAVVVLALNVAARQMRLLDELVVAVAAAAGLFDVGEVRARSRIARSLDVVTAVAVVARCGHSLALLAGLAVRCRRVLLDGVLMTVRAGRGLQLFRMRQLVDRNVGMAIRALELHLAVH